MRPWHELTAFFYICTNMEITKKDVFWNYGATFMRVASGMIILPLIIKLLPIEDVGLWGIFFSLEALIYILDFGFYTTISRNITYIFAGAKNLKKEGVDHIPSGSPINYRLLKGLLKTARIVYASVSVIMLALFLTVGTIYINKVLTGYAGDAHMARTAWYLYGLLLCYRFYTYYYDALLVGRGMIMRSKQITIFSQMVHLVTASILLLSGYGIISMVFGQILATVVNRYLANRAFYDKDTKWHLHKSTPLSTRNLLKTLWPTVYKSGVSSISSVLLKNIIPLIGGLYIPLQFMGYYSISKTIVDVTFSLGCAWFMAYYPKITKERSQSANNEVKRLFVKGQIISLFIFGAIALFVLSYGNEALSVLKKDAVLLAAPLLAIYFISSFADSITDMSTKVILSNNRVPYYRSQFITAIASITILVAVLQFYRKDVAVLILVPFLSQLAYQHWRWFLLVWRELGIKLSDYSKGIKNLIVDNFGS